MDRLIALPSYDVVAYLMIGIVAFAFFDLIYGTRVILRGDWNVGIGTLTVIAAYIAGHMLSTLAGLTIERGIVVRLMCPPIVYLLQYDRCKLPANWIRTAFTPYYEPEPALQTKLKSLDPPPPDDEAGLSWETYNAAKQDKNAYERIVTYLQLFSFCRNLSFTAFLAAIGLSIQMARHRWAGELVPQNFVYGFPRWLNRPGWQLVAFLVIAAIFFHRYLYMYRMHTIEVLTSYAYGQ